MFITRYIKPLSLLTIAIVLAVAAPFASAALVPIVNPSFELDTIPAGQDYGALSVGWSAYLATPYLTDIVPLGADYLNPDYGNHSDTIVGYFRPLLADNTDNTFVDGLSFMIVNGNAGDTTPYMVNGQWHDAMGMNIPVDANGVPDPAAMAANSAEALGEWYHVAFDFAVSFMKMGSYGPTCQAPRPTDRWRACGFGGTTAVLPSDRLFKYNDTHLMVLRPNQKEFHTRMRFTKMHGAGNDYVYVDCFNEKVPDNLPLLARRISDRHRGVGGDGLVLIHPSDVADARMQMFNADGSQAEMCGNAVRCVAKYVHDHGYAKSKNLRIETGAGVLSLDLEIVDSLTKNVTVDMGEPILRPDLIPTTLGGRDQDSMRPVIDAPLIISGRKLAVTCVSMGNPHCVTYVKRLSDWWVLGLGPKIERDSHFPNRVNAEFVEIISDGEIRIRVWERGSGETLACGTGACAACVACVLSGRGGREIIAHLPGGDLRLSWREDTNHVFMTGPAVEVFSGEWPLDGG